MNQFFVPPFSASFGNPEDFLKIGEKILIGDKYEKGGFILWSDKKHAIITTSDTHIITFGGTGSGKTRRIAVEEILIIANSTAKESIIAHFPKGDEVDKLYKSLKKLGYTVFVINFRDPKCSDSFNPYDPVTDLLIEGKTEKVDEVLNEINERLVSPYLNSDDPYWQQQTAKYINALYKAIAALTDNNKLFLNFNNIISLHRYLVSGEKHVSKLLNKLKEKGADEAAAGISGIWNNARETRANLITMVELPFAILNGVSAVTYKSSFSTEDLAEKPCAVFLVTPDESSTYDGYISLIVEAIYNNLIKYASGCNNAALNKRVNYIIDEFSNLPRLNSISKMISSSRSRQIRFHLISQNYSQLINTYGEATAKNIIDNCQAITCLQGNDIELGEYFSALAGEKMLNYSQRTVKLISPLTLRKLAKGQAIVLSKELDPIRVTYPDISEYTFDYSPSGYLKKERKNNIKMLNWEDLFADKEAENKKDNKSLNKNMTKIILNDIEKRKAFFNDVNRKSKYPFAIDERLGLIEKKPNDIILRNIKYGMEQEVMEILMNILNTDKETAADLTFTIYSRHDPVLIRCQNKIQYYETLKLLKDICEYQTFGPDGEPDSSSTPILHRNKKNSFDDFINNFRHNEFDDFDDDDDDIF